MVKCETVKLQIIYFFPSTKCNYTI